MGIFLFETIPTNSKEESNNGDISPSITSLKMQEFEFLHACQKISSLFRLEMLICSIVLFGTNWVKS